MDTYWVPGVNRLKKFGRWAFVELREIMKLEPDFDAKIKESFDRMIKTAIGEENG